MSCARGILILVLACVFFQPSLSQAPNDSSIPTLKIETRHVLVPVIVTGKDGKAVDGLKAEDFEVLDERKPRPILNVNVERRLALTQTAQPSATQLSQPAPQAPTPAQPIPPRFTVFYFDDLHLDQTQMHLARKAASAVLSSVLEQNGYVAIVSATGAINSGLTRKTGELERALESLQPHLMNRSTDTNCPRIEYDTANRIINQFDVSALEIAMHAAALECHIDMPDSTLENIVRTVARQALISGNQDMHQTYASLGAYVRKMAKLPGRRVLLVVSPGFNPTDPTIRSDESAFLDYAIQSDVVVNALDARGVYTNSLTASDDTHGATGQAFVELESEHRNKSALAASGLGDLASGTGGVLFQNSNDLAAGMRELSQPPEILYQLDVSLNGVQPDGAYHHLKIKVKRPDVHVRARDGYVAVKM